ncbi:LysR family transcriptional regulator [Sediminicoccus sp. KRV36]|uniref:LysR family transcriptional regulator n=1 Tax=Sediminicoccus sp. KRV36 TaxID=3133721 RepID=UPI00200E6803|nr:LysR family transcriptional regulator [Sediminicoccus rosea]UPY36516.1 LysR family transcriptional regulator [Sediminicoccus rosea]
MAHRALPPLTAIRAFEAAARHLSMTGAARELSVTPGAVSRQIRELEQSLGVTLFLRQAQGLVLTTAGETLAAGAGEALDRLAIATGRARLGRGRPITVGVYGYFASRLLFPRLRELQRALPDLVVEWHTSSSPLDLLPGRFDAVIAVSEPQGMPGLVVLPLVPIATLPVCAPQWLEGGGLEGGGLEGGAPDFARIPLLHSRCRPDDWRRWLNHAGHAKTPLRGGSTFESMNVAMEAAAQGLGAVIAIEALLAPDLARGAVVPAHAVRRPTRRHFTLQYETRHAGNPDLRMLADWLRGEFAA